MRGFESGEEGVQVAIQEGRGKRVGQCKYPRVDVAGRIVGSL